MRILKLRQVEVDILIYHQILGTNLQGNELKIEGRIDNQILGVKGSTANIYDVKTQVHLVLSILKSVLFSHSVTETDKTSTY